MRLRTLVAACVCAAFSVGFAIEACASAFDEDGGVLSPLPTADPTSPDVDETTLVAIPKMSVSRDAMESVLRGVSRSARLGLRSATRGTRFALVETDGRTSPDLARTMADSGLFEVVDYSVRYHPAYGTNPNDPHFVSQWPLKFEPGANFASIWPALASMPGGDAAPVAVIDVGCYLNHPDRGSNMVGGFDFGQNRVDVTPSRPDLAGSWHGSQVASIIGSATDNGKGIAGAGWDTKVICYKASDGNGELNTLAVATSIQDSAVRGVKVVNISLTSDQKDSTLQYSIDMVLKQGVVVVAAAGNNGAPTPIAPGATPNAPNYPASFPGVLAVGATDPTGARAPFSNTNPETHIDLVAPGVGIHGWCQPGYCELDGTSFAAPFVSAAAALVMRARPGL
ncbi:MAG: S8 family serine peptidase, partial [Micrococcales bacterium]|nr:S8 family serine peptidase [Micrococcales bacterium]